MANAKQLPNGLTEKQEAFCLQYLVDLNGPEAAVRAGYAEGSKDPTACKLLKKPKIQARICDLKKERNRRTMLVADDVLLQWAKSAMFDYRSLFNEDGSIKKITEMDDICGQMITGAKVRQVSKRVYDTDGEDLNREEVTVDVIEVKILDKHVSLTNLANHMGLTKPEDAGSETAKTLAEVVDRLVPTMGPTCELPNADSDSIKH